MIRAEQGKQSDISKEGVLFREDHKRESDANQRKAKRVVRPPEIFPEQPKTQCGPEGEEPVDERVLRHVDLGGRATHERENAKRPDWPR